MGGPNPRGDGAATVAAPSGIAQTRVGRSRVQTPEHAVPIPVAVVVMLVCAFVWAWPVLAGR